MTDADDLTDELDQLAQSLAVDGSLCRDDTLRRGAEMARWKRQDEEARALRQRTRRERLAL